MDDVLMGPGEIDTLFSFHPATEDTGPKHDNVRGLLREAAYDLIELMPPSPEATLAVRKLQEAMFYANAAIACRS